MTYRTTGVRTIAARATQSIVQNIAALRRERFLVGEWVRTNPCPKAEIGTGSRPEPWYAFPNERCFPRHPLNDPLPVVTTFLRRPGGFE